MTKSEISTYRDDASCAGEDASGALLRLLHMIEHPDDVESGEMERAKYHASKAVARLNAAYYAILEALPANT
jgi:hypothetical protein